MNYLLLFATMLSSIISLYAPFLTITTPGLYTLGENINYTTGAPGDTIIQITADNVVLDLGKYIITGSTAGLIGITISANSKNVTIKNGTIQNILGAGIVVNQNCSRIFIDGIQAYNCTGRVIDLAGATTPNKITNASLTNCYLVQNCQASGADRVISCVFCEELFLGGLVLSQNGNAAHDLHGIYLEDTQNIRAANIVAQANTAGINLKIFLLNRVTNSLFEQCVANGNSSSSGSGVVSSGFDLANTTNSIFLNCFVINQTASTGKAAGFNLTTNSSTNIFSNCINNSARTTTSGTTSGFSLAQSNTNTFAQCISQNNNAAGIASYGMDLINTSSNKINDGLFTDNISTLSSIGIFAQNCSSLNVNNNLIANNQGSGTATSFGLYQTGTIVNNLYTRNICTVNGTTAGNQTFQISASSVTPILRTNINGIGNTLPWTNPAIT